MARSVKENIKDLQLYCISNGDGGGVGIYGLPLADGKLILINGAEANHIPKVEKEMLRNMRDWLSEISSSDILALFQDKEEGMVFLNQKEIPLLDLHNRLNSVESFKLINMSANVLASYFFPDIVGEGNRVFLTCTILSEKDDNGEQYLVNAFIDQGQNKAYKFKQAEGVSTLVEPMYVEELTDMYVSYYIIRDLIFRLQIAENPEFEGQVETIEDFLLPVDTTLVLLLESGEISTGV